MGFFELIGIAIVLYYLVYLVLWVLLDSDVELWWKEKTGRPIGALRGKVVWITGASSGIGKALAQVLAEHGVRLILSARRVELLEAVRADCLQRSGGQLTAADILVLPMDMLRTEEMPAKLTEAVAHFGGVDVLVNNAGRSQRAAWQDVQLAVDRELFELDVFSVVALTRVYLRHVLAERGGRGHVAVTSSSAGLVGVPNSCSYVGAKFAVHGYMESLKAEQPQLDVTVFCPGPTTTEFLENAFTASEGEKYAGGVAESSAKRMSARRCAELMAVALANKTYVSFVGPFPVPLLLNVVLYYPNLKKLVMKWIGAGGLKKIRDPEQKNE